MQQTCPECGSHRFFRLLDDGTDSVLLECTLCFAVFPPHQTFGEKPMSSSQIIILTLAAILLLCYFAGLLGLIVP